MSGVSSVTVVGGGPRLVLVGPASGGDSLPSQSGNSGKYLTTNGTSTAWDSPAGAGTVTTFSVVTANGVSASVANATSTPAATFTLGAVTPTSVNGLTITTTTGTITITNGKTLAVSNTLTLAGTDGSTLNMGTGGTLGTGAFQPLVTRATLGIAATDAVTFLSVATGNGVTATGVCSFFDGFWVDALATWGMTALGAVAASSIALDSPVTVGNGGTGLSALGTALQVLRVNAGASALEFATLSGGGNAQTADPLSQFAATTSAQLAGVISDETGTGSLVFATSPTFVTPLLGTPTSGNLANCTFPTLNQSTTGSAATLTTTRTIGGSNFNGSANVTSFPSPGAIGGTTPSSGAFTTLAVNGVMTLTSAGAFGYTGTDYNFQIASTGAVTIQSGTANDLIIGGITPSAGTFTTLTTTGNIELGHASDTTLSRSSAGNVAIEGNVIYRAGGTDVAVADGGTGLSSGTSGGVLAFTASGTLASSGALAANAIVIGGGAGVAPSTTTTGTGVLTQLGLPADGTDVDAIGYRGLPQVSFSAATNIIATHNGCTLLHPSSDANARTLTIQANGTLALEVGFAFEVINDSANDVTLAITTDTLVQAGTGTTGSITIPQYGCCFVRKIASTRWYATPVVS